MKHKHRALKTVLICVITVLFLNGAVALCTLSPIADWLLRPREITFAEGTANEINSIFGVSLPQDFHFVKGYKFPSRDSAYIYIFETDTVSKSNEETTDRYLRRVLSADDRNYPAVSPEAGSLFGSYLAELDYSFTSVMTPQNQDFAEIHYARSESGTCLIAFVYSES